MLKAIMAVKEKTKNLYNVLIYGSIWGLIELSLGGFLHYIHHPQKGKIMAAIAYTIMLTYLLRVHNKKIIHTLYIGIIAAFFKIFNIFIFGIPIFSRSIINPALAIITEAATVTLGAFVVVYTLRVLKLVRN